MNSKIRVLITEDHPLFREGIKKMINDENDVEVVGEAENGKRLLSLLRKVKCDIVLLDGRMPVMDGWKTLPKLTKEYPAIKVIMLTVSNEKESIEYFLSHGARAFLNKTYNSDKILNTIYTVHQNGYCVPDGYTEEVFKLKLTDTDKPRISARELEVLEAFSDGLTEKQTAEKLKISQHTVHSHRMNMINKTGSNNIARLIKYAFTNAWFNK